VAIRQAVCTPELKLEYSIAVRSVNANIADKPFFRLRADRYGNGKAIHGSWRTRRGTTTRASYSSPSKKHNNQSRSIGGQNQGNIHVPLERAVFGSRGSGRVRRTDAMRHERNR
jgi:hypothetical protein